MPLSRTRDYLSIGEVLDALRADFPDVSVSKIRFLESEGLISPERTGSGYRKFFDGDVARLRQILALQRDHFMPLKVIKDHLDKGGPVNGGPPAPPVAATAPARSKAGSGTPAGSALTDVSLGRREFLKAAGITEAVLKGLEDFGLLDPRAEGEAYDGADLAVATAARGFMAHGLEPRHLKMYRQFADREAALFEQLVGPLRHQRSPSGTKNAEKAKLEMVELSRVLREALLRTAVRRAS